MDHATWLGAEPGEVARPATVEDAAALVARANEDRRAVIPWGGGTAQDYGHLPRRADLVLDTAGLNRIVSHEPGDMTVTVQPGATLAQVQETLAGEGQFLPLDPGQGERATIGGILATNAWGPSRLLYGTARDWLIGLSLVEAQGRVVKGGGKVVKNVTGYDLPKLHVGALGTLGVIVEATFKVAPLPEDSLVLRYPLAPGARSDVFLLRLHGEHSPALSVLLDEAAPDLAPAPGRHLFVAFDGPREVVRSAAAAADRIAAECGIAAAALVPPEVRSRLAGGNAVPGRLRVRFSGCASAAYAQHEAVVAMPGWEWIRTLAGTGHTEALLRGDEDSEARAAEVLAWAKERQTPVTLLQAPPSVRRDAEVWSPLPPGFALMRRMKEALDPRSTLNPGRFIGKI